MTNRYLPVSVYRSAGSDCTLGGVTATDEPYLVVPCPDGHVTEEDVADRGYTVLVPGHKGGLLNFTPEGVEGWSMMGGNFVYTSDSRFSRLYGSSPIAVHDRFER